MLKHLYISQFAIIDTLNLDIRPGFNVITGQTGAGKSIIMGALALVMGDRADYKAIRNGANKCVVEAIFDVSSGNLKSLFDELDLDYADECTIRREITSAGKSRAFINDTPVNQQQLRSVTSHLIDIHSQHENLLLNNSLFQLKVVDAVARNTSLVSDYKSAFNHYSEIKKQLNTLQENAEKWLAEKDYNQFQFNQLHEADIRADEQTELEAELEKLSHIEDIKSALQVADAILSNDDAAIAQLKIAEQNLGKIADFDKDFADIYGRLNSSIIDLKDVAADVSSAFNNADYDPQRKLLVEERLNTIYSLEHKHNVNSCEELISIYNAFAEKLARIDSFDDDIKALQMQLKEAEKVMITAADALSASRLSVKDLIEKELSEKLVYLGINNANVEVNICKTDNYTVNGHDEVSFLFSANKNAPLRPIATIASGGEISRVMLAIKSLIVKTKDIATIIFDEIDTGVSGLVAQRMGEMMKSLSSDIQVIAITHLPQIAAKGTTHFKVYKVDDEKDTLSKIIPLNDEQRLLEIAEMLSSENPTQAAVNAAKELLLTDK